jgi:hypothetical protein
MGNRLASWLRQYRSATDPVAWALAILAFLAVVLAVSLVFDWPSPP